MNIELCDAEQGRVLIVEDDEDLCATLCRSLRKRDGSLSVESASNTVVFRKLVDSFLPEVVVLDLVLGDGHGLEAGFDNLLFVRKTIPSARIIVLTGHANTELGIKALQSGAANFLQKPPQIEHLFALIRDGILQARLFSRRCELQRSQEAQLRDVLVGNSRAVQALRERILFLGQTDQPVLILGETGTGKSHIAHILHKFSTRSSGRFIRYQSTLCSRDLESSELFGHVRGAFTGAGEGRKGLIEEAEGGTLFLDEIDTFSSSSQALLLQSLQDGVVRRVGENKERTVDFRLICATNADLEDALGSGRLRRDFYHRVAHATIELPPLRSRIEDIPFLVNHVLLELNSRGKVGVLHFSVEALERLANYLWPGNVRQLFAVAENAMYRAAFDGRREVSHEDVNSSVGRVDSAPVFKVQASQLARESGQSFREQVESFQKTVILDTLVKFNGNQSKAARYLDMDRTSFRRLLSRYRNEN